MPITYSIDRGKRLITEVWTGQVDAQYLAAYWKRYLDDPDVMTIRRTLVDMRQADILFKGSDLDILIQELVLPLLKGRDWKTAIVVEKPVQYGTSRQYQIFAERYSRDAIFYDLEAGRMWLAGLPD